MPNSKVAVRIKCSKKGIVMLMHYTSAIIIHTSLLLITLQDILKFTSDEFFKHANYFEALKSDLIVKESGLINREVSALPH